MKVIHGSLKNLLQEVKDKKVDAVRVAGFMLSGRHAPRRAPWQAKVDEEVLHDARILGGRGRQWTL